MNQRRRAAAKFAVCATTCAMVLGGIGSAVAQANLDRTILPVPEPARPLYKEVVAAQAAWRTSLPLGKSSPAMWGSRIFLTGVESGRLATLALDAQSGNILWKKLAPKVRLESVHTANSAAASTPCADEGCVSVYFGSYGLLCYDRDGREKWKKAIATPQSMYGVATSPILHAQQLILLLDDDANMPDSKLSRSKVIALNKTTVEPVWETPRPYNRGAWSSPYPGSAKNDHYVDHL